MELTESSDTLNYKLFLKIAITNNFKPIFIVHICVKQNVFSKN